MSFVFVFILTFLCVVMLSQPNSIDYYNPLWDVQVTEIKKMSFSAVGSHYISVNICLFVDRHIRTLVYI